MRGPRRALTLAATAVLLLCVEARPQAEPLPTDDLQNLRTEIREMKSNLDHVRGRAASAERDLEATGLELAIFERELQVASQVEAMLEKQKQEITQRVGTITRDVERQKLYLGDRLAALYKLGSLSYLRLLLSMEDQERPLEAVTMLSYLVSRDGREIQRYRNMRGQLGNETAALAARSKKIAELRAFAERKRVAIAQRKREQERLLLSLRKVEGQTEVRLAELEERAQRLERLLTLLYERKGSETPQAARISEFKGAIQWPIRGPVLEGFGRHKSQKFATYTVSNGIKIGATPGAPVGSVFYGTVIYSQWFKGYGNLMVIDHGERVYSLYGNSRGPLVSVGNKVSPGQVITGVAEGDDGTGYLYFEVREDNKPADPRRWLR